MASNAETKVKLRVIAERGTTWVTVDGAKWIRNGYPQECVDKFWDVWLKPYRGNPNLYVTVEGAEMLFTIENGCLEEA